MRILLPTLHVRPSAQAIPLAAGCLKACLPQPLRDQTLLLDLYPGANLEDLATDILGKQPQIIAFPLYLWNRSEVLRLCRELRRRQPELCLLAGGPEASADSRRVIDEGQLNGVIRGEGELSFALLMDALSSGRSGTEVPGYLVASDPVDQPCPAACCPNLSRLPSPWLDGILPLSAGCGVLWEVARGCRFNCAFCYDAKGHQGVRPLPEARLQAELDLFTRNRVGQIWVLDSTFNAPAERGKLLLELLLERAPQIHFHLEAKADFLDRETAELLSHLSCSVQIGLQTADEAILRPLHRAFDRNKMPRQLELLSSAEITFGLDLIYGLPGDNHAGFCRSLDFALNQQPNQVDIFPLAVLPGTELHHQGAQLGIDADANPPYLIKANPSYPAEQLEQSRNLAAAVDIFYNRGRAVGFFRQLCDSLRQTPSHFCTNFDHWLCRQPGIGAERLHAVEHWHPTEILPLQLGFAAEQLQAAGLEKQVPLCEDLILYHYLCAETLLAADCHAAAKLPEEDCWRETVWTQNPPVRVQRFHYDLEELEIRGGEPWGRLVKQLAREPSYGIFLRQHGQPLIEALEENFARLLLGSTGRKTANQLLHGLPRREGEELLRFAVTEGLLWPLTNVT